MADDFGFEEEHDFGFEPEGAPAAAAPKKGMLAQAWDNLTHMGERSKEALAHPQPQKSSYEGIPDEKLSTLQKLDRFFAKPGHEMISPASLRQKQLAAETAVNTGTFGYLPQIYGGVKTAMGEPGGYVANRDAMVDELGQAKGGTAAIGNALGMLPTLFASGLLKAPQAGASLAAAEGAAATGKALVPAAAPGAGVALPGAAEGAAQVASKAVPAAAPSATMKLGQAMGQAGAQGFLANPGDKPGELSPLQIGPRVSNARDAALTAGVLHTATQLPEMAASLRKTSNVRAVKQAGAMLPDMRKLEQKGRLMERPGQTRPVAGEVMHQEGIISPLATTEDIGNRSQALVDREMAKVNQVYEVLDANHAKLSAVPSLREQLPSGARMADAIESKLINPNRGMVAYEPHMGELQAVADAFRAKGNQPMTFSQARKQIQAYDDILSKSWGKEGSVGTEFAKDVRGVLNGVLEDGVDAIGKATKFPLLENFQKAKHLSSVGIDLKDIAKDYEIREFKNRYVSPSDYGAGAIGAVMGSGHGTVEQAIAAAAAAAANHGMRKYGNALVSTGARKASDMLSNPAIQAGANFVGSRAVQAGGAVAQAEAGSAPQTIASQRQAVVQKLAGTPYAQQLQNAKTDDDFALRYFTLSQQQPGFRDAMAKGQPNQ